MYLALRAQSQFFKEGENAQKDSEQRTDAWIKGHQSSFDGWIDQAPATCNMS